MDLDLHTHTTFSDGTTSPAQNAALAAAAGLGGLALTDHDTTEGWAQAAEACARRGLQFVPGVELSAELDQRSVHLLGYWVDPEHREFAAECDRLRDERLHRARAIVALLDEQGVKIDWERVLAHAGEAPIGRPHIAAAMVEAGSVADFREAFDGWLRDGGPAWVPKHALAPVDAVRLIRAAGGAAVLAHPGLSSRDAPLTESLVDELVDAGLGGIEANHPGHDEDMVSYWRKVADARGLLVTGSSDFHGDNKELTLGTRRTPAAVVAALRERTQ